MWMIGHKMFEESIVILKKLKKFQQFWANSNKFQHNQVINSILHEGCTFCPPM